MNISSKEGIVIKIILITLFSFFFNNGFAQSILDKTISFSAKDISINDALLQVSKLADTDIAFSNRFFKDHEYINIEFDHTSLKDALEIILSNAGVEFKLTTDRILIYKKKIQFYTISGYVQDKDTGERLIAATVYCPELEKGTTSNEYGFYSFTLPKGNVELVFSYIGYEIHPRPIDLNKNTEFNIELQAGTRLQEIIVTPKSSIDTTKSITTEISLSPPINKRYSAITDKLVRLSPSLGGIDDPLRATQLLAGVQSGADGLDGIFVRGGDNGQNQFMLDGVPVYIPYHLLGLFSVYNQDIVNSAKFFKGSFPASYGGKLSSIFDIRSREGNLYKWSGNVSSNLINASALVEGPLIKGKSALLIAARSSHSDFLLNPFFKRTYFNSNTGDIQSFFLDFNIKLNFALSKRDHIYFSFYQGQDIISSQHKKNKDLLHEEDLELNWSNSIASFRWNHLFNNKLFSNTTFTYSFFDFEYAVLDQSALQDSILTENSFYIDIYSNNYDIGLKTDFDYIPSANHHIRFGGGFSYKEFIPELTYFDNENELFNNLDEIDINTFEQFRDKDAFLAIESNLYFEDQIKLLKKWDLNLGFRASIFSTENKNYFRLEPRIFSTYKIRENISAKASFSRMVQYLHLISHSRIRMPNGIWMPSSKQFLPEEAWLSELGINLQTKKNITISLDFYYKRMNNLYSFSDDYTLSEGDFRDFLIKGKGQATGMEFALQYTGRNNGIHLSYALTNSFRQFENINSGEPYPHPQGYPHQVKTFAYQKLGQHFHLSMNWVYNVAGPLISITSLNGLQEANQNIPSPDLPEFLKDYHRLDFSMNYKINTKKTNHLFKIGIYNLYNRKNLAYYRTDIDQAGNIIYLPVNGIAIRPSFSYRIAF